MIVVESIPKACADRSFKQLWPKHHRYYLFNIFDYFDNENIIVNSAMGKKRMILGAYAINFFRNAGFQMIQNIIWYKGEIEGKRAFNQGNFSPYYQLPLNCWEHILSSESQVAENGYLSLPSSLSPQ